MCSRESCSVVPSRFLVGLLILLGAFLLGLVGVAWLTNTPTLGPVERAFDLTGEVTNCTNADHVEMQIIDTGVAGELRSQQLNITNNGSEAIYFFPYDLWVRGQNSPFDYPAATRTRSEAFQEVEIPSGSTLSVPMKNAVPEEAIFRYRIGEARSFGTITAHFSDGCR